MTAAQRDRLVLGTAQLNADYGIANTTGKPSRREALAILERAWSAGIRRIDTAPAYGSEPLIGEFIRAHGLGSDAAIITKLPSIGALKGDVLQVWGRSLDRSLRSLGVERLEAVLLHDPADRVLLQAIDVAELVASRPIATFGVSLYEPSEAEVITKLSVPAACQFPVNVLDRRFLQLIPDRVHRYARSVFLQGLLAGTGERRREIPPQLAQAVALFHAHVPTAVSPRAVALSFVFYQTGSVDSVLVGIDAIEQLEDLVVTDLPSWSEELCPTPMVLDNELDPRRW